MSNPMPKQIPNLDPEPTRFPSLVSLRAAHTELLRRYRDCNNTPELSKEIRQFMWQGCVTGVIFDNEDDRWTAQGLLDYWSSILYRAGQEPPDTTLADFDSSLVPDLKDDLCPYVGLESFHSKNQHLFFGRQKLLDKLLKHIAKQPLLMVVGASGSGKSSVVLGGLLPRLVAGALPGSQDWVYYAPLVPGSNPLTAMTRLLKPAENRMDEWIPKQIEAFQQDPHHLVKSICQPDHHPVVLIIDQFEEVFTLCRDNSLREALVQNLLNFIESEDQQNRLILTMRTDFESQLVRIPNLLQLFEASHVRTTAMDTHELREAIEQPAALIGLKFEEGLVDEILGDVLGEPAALPLLQFTLLKLWDLRDRNRVTWEAYRSLGGGRLALAKSADEFYGSLIPEEQVTMRRILLSMVRPGEGLEVTSSRIPRKDLYRSGEAKDRIDRVLERLIQMRLVHSTAGDKHYDAQVEVAHEALIRNWPRFVNWLEDERIKLRQRLRLTAAAEQWKSKKHDSSTLLRGVLLEEAQRYEDLSELEAKFIQISRHTERRKRSIVVSSILSVFLLLSATSAVAIFQAIKANEQSMIAKQQRKIAEKNALEAKQQRKKEVEQRKIIENLFLGGSSRVATSNLSPRLKTFLDMIAWSLGTLSENGYSQLITGETFNSFSDHPKLKICGELYGIGKKELCADSAGRYEIISYTWDPLAERLDLPDFSPKSQDAAAVELLREADALKDIESGNIESAIHKASLLWATLPDENGKHISPFQPRSMKELKFMYSILYTRYSYPQ